MLKIGMMQDEDLKLLGRFHLKTQHPRNGSKYNKEIFWDSEDRFYDRNSTNPSIIDVDVGSGIMCGFVGRAGRRGKPAAKLSICNFSGLHALFIKQHIPSTAIEIFQQLLFPNPLQCHILLSTFFRN